VVRFNSPANLPEARPARKKAGEQMDDAKNQDIAEYFVSQSWVMLDEAKTIVEYAVDNPSSNLEARLYDMMYEGVSKTLTEVNHALNANKTISEETKATYRKDFQS
jgi:phage terminase large subunit